MKYRMKEVVDAVQWFKYGDHEKVFKDSFSSWKGYVREEDATDEESFSVLLGVWVITGEDGKLDWLNDEDFKREYEEA